MILDVALFPDPVEVGLRALRGAFKADPLVAEADPTISQAMPKRDSDTVRPSILVADDGDAGTGFYPVSEDALLRVTVWDRDAYRAGELARLARAYLLADPGSSGSRGFTRGTRPTPGTDPDDGTPLSSFIIIARLKAETGARP